MFDEFYKKLIEGLRSEIAASEERLRLLIQINRDADRISYSIHEAAQITGIGYDTLYARCKAGKLQYSQDGPGAAIIITRQTLIEYVNTHCKQQPSPQPTDQTEDVARPVRLRASPLRTTHSRQRFESD